VIFADAAGKGIWSDFQHDSEYPVLLFKAQRRQELAVHPKTRFSLSQLNWNDSNYSLQIPCPRSFSLCSTRFGKVSGIEPCPLTFSFFRGL